MTGKKKRTVYSETLIKPFQNQERTKMVAEAIEPSVTLNSIALKINQGLEELTATDLKELQSIAVHDINHEVIPALNRAFLQNKVTSDLQIVRFTGMVQDMLEPEFYVSKVQGVNTHFRDFYPEAVDEMDLSQHLAERHPLVVVPLPYYSGAFGMALETKGEDSLHDNTANSNVAPSNKREIGQVNEEEHEIRRAPGCGSSTASPVSTRDATVLLNCSSATTLKQNDWWPAGTLGSNHGDCPVLAKLYYEQTSTDNCRLKLNQIVELIGVLSLDPFEADFDVTDDSFGVDRLIIPPPSLLPRLHVLCVTQVDLEGTSQTENSVSEDEKKRILQYLTEQVGGETTAEALLMVLLSLAERQPDAHGAFIPVMTMSETTLGCASLNLILPDEGACVAMQGTLEHVLRQFLPIVASCSLAELGRSLVSPEKTNSGRLNPSPLQLPKGAAIIINEATMQPGPIEPRSLATLAALSNLSQSHRVPYHFNAMIPYQWEADYRVIVLSASNRGVGSKLMPCGLQHVVHDAIPSSRTCLPKETVNAISSYLTKVRTMTAPHHKILLDDVLEDAQREFIKRRIQARQSGTTECGEQDLHRWIALTALQTRSRGAMTATLQDWNASLCLDETMR